MLSKQRHLIVPNWPEENRVPLSLRAVDSWHTKFFERLRMLVNGFVQMGLDCGLAFAASPVESGRYQMLRQIVEFSQLAIARIQKTIGHLPALMLAMVC